MVGGVSTNGSSSDILNTIEQWNGKCWTIINVCIIEPRISPGCFAINDNKILVAGGQGNNRTFSNYYYTIDIDTGAKGTVNVISKQTKFTYGQTRKVENKIFFCDWKGEIFNFDLDNI